ncbi:gluconate 2-dehydrogenase subunit 3 family protein [Perlucidibaca aquatica]|uniref:gluconate 2-dehydrogenase subunit 3 family protein n=1 Tax=Perlucidibaca aquatica TaxID=1852776 RepID=UPI000B8BBE95|nr:gluconate 2-dehydrogenase subunit 3 family protein [Perlucidibaca aquatica]
MNSNHDDFGGINANPIVPRRTVLKVAGAVLISAWLLPISGCLPASRKLGRAAADMFGPAIPTPYGRFLTADERKTLRAFVDRLIPGGDRPGAVDAECDVAIDAFLAAFLTDPPLIYAGAPFSDRGGAMDNGFARFIPLDAYEELAWRIVIEGSQGLQEREVNGPVKGLQQIFREGLAHLEMRAQAAGGGTFADLPAIARDLIVFDVTDNEVQALVDVAFPATLNAMYGAPEYGGNKNLVGWTSNDFEGDVQPRGYTDAQVVNSDTPLLIDTLLPPSYGRNSKKQQAVATAVPKSLPIDFSALPLPLLLMSAEGAAGMIGDAQGSLARLRASLEPYLNSSAILRWENKNA